MAPTAQSTAPPTAVNPAPRERTVGLLRLAFALFTTAAVLTTLDQLLGRGGSAVNFFSYFTILSNILGIVVFYIGGFAPLRGGAPVNDYLRGAACLYLTITGVVYWTLLRNVDTPEGHSWTNLVVHGIMPAAVLVDWLLVPPRKRLERSGALYWLIFPLVYLAYSLIRGPIAQWYPYPFLDPRTNGYVHVAIMSVVVTIAFLLFTALIVAVGNRLGSRANSSSAGSHV